MSKELKSCPFCGGEAVIANYDNEEWLVYCPVCKGMRENWFATEQQAIAAWNTRAERTCTMRGSYGIGVEYDPLEGWTCSACGSYVDVENFNFDELYYCPNCGAKVMSE